MLRVSSKPLTVDGAAAAGVFRPHVGSPSASRGERSSTRLAKREAAASGAVGLWSPSLSAAQQGEAAAAVLTARAGRVAHVGLAVQAVDPDSDVAQACHHARSRAGADAGAVFAVGDVAHVVQAVLDAPVTAQHPSQIARPCLLAGEAGDGERDVSLADWRAGECRPFTDDHDHLPSRWEAGQRRVRGHLDYAQGSLLDAPVAAIVLDMVGPSVRPRAIDQPLAERWLVVLYRQDVVPFFLTIISAVALCVCIASIVTVTPSRSSSARMA